MKLNIENLDFFNIQGKEKICKGFKIKRSLI